VGFLGLFKKAPAGKELRAMLPSRHSFVDVAVRNGPKGSVCFENVGPKAFVTSVLPGMSPGQQVTFNYQNGDGKYRFSTALKAVDAKQATFELPATIETVQKFGGSGRRTTVRVNTIVTIQWRYSSTGQIESEWQKGVLRDISRGGSLLATDKVIKVGTMLELKIPLSGHGQPIAARADARRVYKIEGTAKFNIGLSFRALAPDAERSVIDFINRRQVDLRARGLG
jgi:c-di-GMP-binding flagellar brake protein YcgR